MINQNTQNLFFEKLDYTVDIEKLKQEVKKSVFTLGVPVIQGEGFETEKFNGFKGFGGWSLLSKDAKWTSGWETLEPPAAQSKGVKIDLEKIQNSELLHSSAELELFYKAQKYFNISHGSEHNKPTEACVGEIEKVLNDIREMGFYPARARITCLKAHSKTLVHKDAEEHEYMARIHIPLWTNKKCVHICQGKNLHMPADGGVWILWTNTWHQIRNDSDEDRYHIIMDAYDTKKITKTFNYNGEFEQLQNHVLSERKKIDSVELTKEDIDLFESIKKDMMPKEYEII